MKKNKKNSSQMFRCSDKFSEKLQQASEITGFDKTTILQAGADYFMSLSRENQSKLIAHHMICEALRLNPDAMRDYGEEIRRLWPVAYPQEEKQEN